MRDIISSFGFGGQDAGGCLFIDILFRSIREPAGKSACTCRVQTLHVHS